MNGFSLKSASLAFLAATALVAPGKASAADNAGKASRFATEFNLFMQGNLPDHRFFLSDDETAKEASLLMVKQPNGTVSVTLSYTDDEDKKNNLLCQTPNLSPAQLQTLITKLAISTAKDGPIEGPVRSLTGQPTASFANIHDKKFDSPCAL